MEEGGLTLPTPAASLWRATREAITDALTNIGHPGIYRMGGGTILAARWRHRRSWDIDLQVDPGTDLGKLDENRVFRAKMKALGGTPSYDPQLKLYRILFDDEQAIELWSHRPPITRGARREQVDGRNEWLLSTTQILRGKLERGHKKLARDVYDIRTAAELNDESRRSLEQAVNALSPSTIETIALDWIVGYGRIGNAARQRLQGLAEGEGKRHYRLGSEGAAALHASRYRQLRISVEQTTIVVEATTWRNDSRRMETTATDVDDKFEAWGLNAYLDENGGRAETIREESKRATDARPAHKTVFARTDDQTNRLGSRVQPNTDAGQGQAFNAAGKLEPHPRPTPATGSANSAAQTRDATRTKR